MNRSEISVQVSVEMPFDIRNIVSPTHKIKYKVCFECDIMLVVLFT